VLPCRDVDVAVAFEHALLLSVVVTGGPVSNHPDACVSS
jgi:hypothetical protein